MTAESAQPLTAQGDVQVAALLTDRAHQGQDLAVLLHGADGNAVGIPQHSAGQTAHSGQDHPGGNVVFPANGLDGQQQVVAPVQPSANGSHGRRSFPY